MEQYPIPILLALILGYILKKHPKVANGAIPWLVFASQLLGRLVVEVSPADASVFGSIAKFGGNLVYESLVTTVLAVGAHSSAKNSWPVFKDVLKLILLQKANQKLGPPS